MTSISASTLNPYLQSSPRISIKGAAEETATSPAVVSIGDSDDKAPATGGAQSADGSGSAGGPNQQVIEELKKQIEQTEKLLAQQQAQLARVENSKANEEQKAQQAMALQAQIMGTQATLMSLRGALLQAMTVSVDTHA